MSSSGISYHAEGIDLPSVPRGTRKWLAMAVGQEGRQLHTWEVIFSNDAYLAALHKEWLNQDTYTDILTFDYSEENVIVGESYISYERVCENARTQQVRTEHELCRVILHGILHVCGHDDLSPEQKADMRLLEDHYLAQHPAHPTFLCST